LSSSQFSSSSSSILDLEAHWFVMEDIQDPSCRLTSNQRSNHSRPLLQKQRQPSRSETLDSFIWGPFRSESVVHSHDQRFRCHKGRQIKHWEKIRPRGRAKYAFMLSSSSHLRCPVALFPVGSIGTGLEAAVKLLQTALFIL
jgi:hypothetical protein